MKQSNYETIIRCIQHGAPAIAESLIADLNKTVELSNDRIAYLQEQERLERQRQEAEAATKKKETKDTK